MTLIAGAGRQGLYIACIVVALLPSAAWAHAFLDHASPAVGSTVQNSPSDVKLWFTERLEPAFTTVQVLDKAGKSVGADRGAVSVQDPTLLAIPVGPLAPGTYRVVWRALSVDAHATEGDFTFVVAPGAL